MRSRLQSLLRSLLGGASWINKHSAVRIALIVGAVLFAVLSLVVTDRLVSQMADEERLKMEIWAQATQALASNDHEQALLFPVRILESNKTIPIIVTNEQGVVIQHNNLDLPRSNPDKYLYQKLQEFREGYPPIVIDSYPKHLLYYSDSTMLRQLLIFPYIQLAVFLALLAIAVLAIVSLKRADQNHIWEGLSRETAHQLGTPISSLIAWRELLSTSGTDPMIVHEMGKDIERLEIIADRFQKVGSSPKLSRVEIGQLIRHSVVYMQPRISRQVELEMLTSPDVEVWADVCEPLVAWVFENLIKNAVDAMEARGSIRIAYTIQGQYAVIDVADTGRGIRKAKYEAIFRPGYSTRQRGWGLGLSLARRIIEDYHSGRIFVKQSKVGVGTTFRIMLPARISPHDTPQ